MMRFLLRFNWTMFACTAVLAVLGVVFIGSAGSARAVAALQNAWRTHAVTAAIGFALMFALSALDYRKLLDWTALPCFLLSVAMLVAVLAFGAKIYGGRRWLWFFQPSEIAKLAVILFMAQIFGRHGGSLSGFRGFLVALAILVPPTLLILAEPDLGTALVLVPPAVAMLLAARIWTKGIVAMMLVGVLAAGVILGTVKTAESCNDPDRRERIYARLPFKPHQIARLKTFVNPDSDPYGSGWNLRQAKISIGSGGLTGRGLRKARSNMLKYLPESISMNDFIFCVYAEETGFAGSIALLSLAGLLLLSCAWTAHISPDGCGRLLALGVTALLFAHFFVNIAMSLGMVPITGLPLPFISAGRTFLLTAMSGLGLVQSVSIHGRETTK